MISPAHAQLMARYNRWQNSSLYREADALTDAERRRERGAFFGSIHGTLSHILWADRLWHARFAGIPITNPVPIKDSVAAFPDWEALKRERAAMDETLIAWADRLAPADLVGDLTWYSGAAGRELTKPRWPLIVHMFNHQTHHRGQVHCLLTQCGRKPDATDIPLLPE